MKKDKDWQEESQEEVIEEKVYPDYNAGKRRIVVKRAYPIFGAMGNEHGMIGRLEEGEVIEVEEEVEGWVRHGRGWSFVIED